MNKVNPEYTLPWGFKPSTDSNTYNITVDSNTYINTNTISSIYTSDASITDTSMYWQGAREDLLFTSEIERMCKQYPALSKAYKNFKQIYDLVKDDYFSKQK